MVEERLRKKMDKPKEVFRKAVSNIMNLGHLDYNKSSLYDISTTSLHVYSRISILWKDMGMDQFTSC